MSDEQDKIDDSDVIAMSSFILVPTQDGWRIEINYVKLSGTPGRATKNTATLDEAFDAIKKVIDAD